MVFSSAVFLLLFLPIVFIGNTLLSIGHKRTGSKLFVDLSNLFLLIASLIFYAWGEPVLVLMMVVSIIINHLVGLGISGVRLRHNSGDSSSKSVSERLLLLIGVICDLSLLGYFKYAGFLVRTLNSISGRELISDPGVTLPIGISFFTFQAISYIVDVYRGDTEVSPGIVNTALYISFFPQLIAGPIVKYHDINTQIIDRTVTADKVADGFRRFIYGLGKKVLIANVLGQCADTIYGFEIADVDFRMAWIGAIAYTFQIYYDFSGYSDMAIGLGRMFGFDIPENFNYPYLSRSISEFWRRWHISLGTWFREYVYIPLGGNRRGTVRTYVNLIIVFFLTGLWHGAGFSFIVWGLYHGFFSIAERLISTWRRGHSIGHDSGTARSDGTAGTLAGVKPLCAALYTFLVVNFGWVLFRASSLRVAVKYLLRLIMPWKYMDVRYSYWHYMGFKTMAAGACALVGAGLLTVCIPARVRDKFRGSVAEAVYCGVVFVICLAAIAANTYNPFIYYQF